MEINLLKRYPQTTRNPKLRLRNKGHYQRQARCYDYLYFDGPREYGYGGYEDDGRWKPVAENIRDHFKLKHGFRVLDIGCAKGFLVKELCNLGLNAYGVDISQYAIKCSPPEITGRLHLGTATQLIFPNQSFDVALSINTLHNLEEEDFARAIHEMQRVAKRCYIQVDAYRTEKEKKRFLDWTLTAVTHGKPAWWRQFLANIGYKGDYYWTFV